MLTKSIERLEETLEAETAALQAHDLADLQDFNRRKSQSLLELSRLTRKIQDEAPSPEVIDRLQALRSRLEINHITLEMNLRAVQEVADIVSKAIQSAESDGTYNAAGRY